MEGGLILILKKIFLNNGILNTQKIIRAKRDIFYSNIKNYLYKEQISSVKVNK